MAEGVDCAPGDFAEPYLYAATSANFVRQFLTSSKKEGVVRHVTRLWPLISCGLVRVV